VLIADDDSGILDPGPRVQAKPSLAALTCPPQWFLMPELFTYSAIST